MKTLSEVVNHIPDYRVQRFTQDEIDRSHTVTLTTSFGPHRRMLVMILDSTSLPFNLLFAGFGVLDTPNAGDELWVLHRGCGDNYSEALWLFANAPYMEGAGS